MTHKKLLTWKKLYYLKRRLNRNLLKGKNSRYAIVFNEKVYWKQRCEAAEELLKSISTPKTLAESAPIANENWQKTK